MEGWLAEAGSAPASILFPHPGPITPSYLTSLVVAPVSTLPEVGALCSHHPSILRSWLGSFLLGTTALPVPFSLLESPHLSVFRHYPSAGLPEGSPWVTLATIWGCCRDHIRSFQLLLRPWQRTQHQLGTSEMFVGLK